jgi:type IV pilus assembly protein PilC
MQDNDKLSRGFNFFKRLKFYTPKIRLKDKLFFTQYLRLMLKSGVSISVALKTLSDQVATSSFKKILSSVYHEVENGSSLASSMRRYEKSFGELYVNMIAAGETAGRLEDVLNELFVQTKKQNELASKVKTATAYPLVIILAMIGVLTFLTIFVLPILTGIFNDLDAELPLPTRIIMGFSSFMNQHGLIAIVLFIVFIFILTIFVRTKIGKKVIEAILLRAPIFKDIVIKINVARFSRSLATLLRTDIPIVRSFQISANTIGNLHYRQAIAQMSEVIKSGNQISQIIAKNKLLFPSIMVQVVKVGEETGNLDEALSELADFYEDEIKNILNDLPAIIEPILIMILGLGVALIATAIVMPIYGLAEIM